MPSRYVPKMPFAADRRGTACPTITEAGVDSGFRLLAHAGYTYDPECRIAVKYWLLDSGKRDWTVAEVHEVCQRYGIEASTMLAGIQDPAGARLRAGAERTPGADWLQLQNGLRLDMQQPYCRELLKNTERTR